MKKFSILTLTVLISLSLLAKKVDIENAKNIAKNFYSLQYLEIKGEPVSNLIINSTYMITKSEDTLIYVFNFSDGFVIVSADDVVPPILGFSLKGNYQEGDQPPGFIELFEHYKNQISWAKNNILEKSEKISKKWESLETLNTRDIGECEIWPKVFIVDQLLTTTWDQTCYYNDKCPEDNRAPLGCCNHVFNGCVAVAMSQVMKYWNYPEHGSGSHGYFDGASNPDAYGWQHANFGLTYYEWDEMPDVLTGMQQPPDRSTSNEIDAVSTLIYHCGVSVDMDYGYNGSGALTSATPNALINYFTYASSANYKIKSSYTNSEWETILRSDLKYHQPIIYRGQGEDGGHSFVLDGYSKLQTKCCTYSALFLINWGWGGSYNGYYHIYDLTPDTLSFNDMQAAVVNISAQNVTYSPPPQPGYILAACSPHCRDWEVEYDIQRVPEATSYEWEILGGRAAVTWTDYYAKVWSHHSGTYTLRVRALNHGVPGPWSSQTIEIENCDRSSDTVVGKVIEESSIKTILNRNQINQDEIQVFPNPAKDEIQIYLPANNEKIKIELLDLQGKLRNNITTTNKIAVISTEYLNNGFYIIRIISSQSIEFKKILISK